MKKLLYCLAVTLCAGAAVGLTACSTNETKYLLPEFNVSQGYTVEHVTNMQEDVIFPIEGEKLDHTEFTQSGSLQYGWVIYDGNKDIVGWINAGNGYASDNGKYSYGISSSYVNEVYGYHDTSVTLILKSDIQSPTLSASAGSATLNTDSQPYSHVPAAEVYTRYDAENNVSVACEGADGFTVYHFTVNLEGRTPDDTKSLTITISIG